MKHVCAWCKKLIRDGPEPTSHGICDKCLEEVRKDMKKGNGDKR